jgi:glycosyltransferase involved in cell wall biosynthesis
MNRQYKTLVLGLDHFIDKIGYQATAYQYYRHPLTYLVLDLIGYSLEFSKKYDADVKIVPINPFKRILITIFFLLKKEYTHVEIYDIGRLTYWYMVLSKLTGKKTLYILRGSEFIRRYEQTIKIIKLSDKIFFKEIRHYEPVRKICDDKKLLFLHNAIPAYSGKILDYDSRDIDILFLNSPVKFRNPFLLIDALGIFLEKNKNVTIIMAGFSNFVERVYQQEVLDYIKQKHLDEDIITKPFVNNPFDFHSRAKVFVLPADVIFVNHSLIESMSCGTVPVITRGEGWDKIINDENGFVSDSDAKQFAEQIQKALNKNIWEQKSKKARETAINDFDILQWGRKLLTFKEVI